MARPSSRLRHAAGAGPRQGTGEGDLDLRRQSTGRLAGGDLRTVGRRSLRQDCRGRHALPCRLEPAPGYRRRQPDGCRLVADRRGPAHRDSQPGTSVRAFASRTRTGPTREPRRLSPRGTGRVHPDAHGRGRGLARIGYLRAEVHAVRPPPLPGRPWRSWADRASTAVERQTQCVVSFREPCDRGRLPSTAYLDFSISSVALGPPTMKKTHSAAGVQTSAERVWFEEGSRHLRSGVLRRVFAVDPITFELLVAERLEQ